MKSNVAYLCKLMTKIMCTRLYKRDLHGSLIIKESKESIIKLCSVRIIGFIRFLDTSSHLHS